MHNAGRFFDAQADAYAAGKAGMGAIHEIIAGRLEQALSGDVLSIGGLWSHAVVAPDVQLTIIDASAAMLRQSAARLPGMRLIKADARDLPLADRSFDHVVLPLVLHHVAGRSGAEARAGARAVLIETHRVLRPGGWLWISEFCVSRALYSVECLFAPLTRAFLSLAGAPLVIMHDRSFYETAIARPLWSATQIETVGAPDTGPLDVITPIIGMPWIKVPRALYPVVPTLIRAHRAESA